MQCEYSAGIGECSGDDAADGGIGYRGLIRTRVFFIRFTVAVVVCGVAADFGDGVADVHRAHRCFLVCRTDHLAGVLTRAFAYRAGFAESGGQKQGLFVCLVGLSVAVIVEAVADF